MKRLNASVICHCVTTLPQISQLLTTHIYYLTVPMVDLFRTAVGSAALGSCEADTGVSMGAEVSSEAWQASTQFQGLVVVVSIQVLEGLSFFATCVWWTLHSLLQGLSKWQLRRWPVASQSARESLGVGDIAISDKIGTSTRTCTLGHLCCIFLVTNKSQVIFITAFLQSTLARVIFPKHGFEHGILLHIYLSAFPLLWEINVSGFETFYNK